MDMINIYRSRSSRGSRRSRGPLWLAVLLLVMIGAACDGKNDLQPKPAAETETLTTAEPAATARPGRIEPAPPPAPSPSDNRETTPAEKEFGVKIEGIRTSSGGYTLDFRYRVLEPEKAAPLLAENSEPFIIHPRSGAKLMVPTTPKVGPLKQSDAEPEPGKVYFMMFANPAGFIKPGDTVTLSIGDFKVEGITVE